MPEYVNSVQFSSVIQSCSTLCDPMNCSTPDPSSITNSQSPPKPMSIELVMPSSHLILCHPLFLLPSIFPSIRVFSKESALCNPMDYNMPGFPVHCQLPELAQTHVHHVSDAIQPSHPLSSPSSPPSIFPSIRVFSNQLVLCIRWTKYWSFSFNISPFNDYSGLISFRTG